MISEIIKNRRAVPPRFIDTREVPEDLIARLLENANWAPNHKQTEPWRFMVISGKDRTMIAERIFGFLEEMSQNGIPVNLQKALKTKDNLNRVPLTFAVIMQRDPAQRIPEWEEIAAVSMAVQNMWLTATELNFAAFWATPEFISSLGPVFNLSAGQNLLGFFHVGYPATDYPSPGRNSWEDKVIPIPEGLNRTFVL